MSICFSFSDIDDCVNHTCANGGSCVDGTNSYSCVCTTGYTGDHCQTGNTGKTVRLCLNVNSSQSFYYCVKRMLIYCYV